MITKLKKQQAKYINDEERELLDAFTEQSPYTKLFLQMQEEVIYKAMLFAIKNKNRAARLLVLKGMMPIEEYTSAAY